MTAPTKHDLVRMQNAVKRNLSDFKPTLWVDASVSGVAASGAVQTLLSRDAEHASFSQSTEASRPVMTADARGLELDGSDDSLQCASAILIGVNSRVIALVKTDNIAAAQVVYAQSDKDAVAVYLQLGVTSANYLHYKFNNGGTADELRGNIKLGTGWHVLEWESNGTTIKARVDGEPDDLTVVGGSNAGNWFGDLTNDDNSTIGCVVRSGGTSGYWNGTIAEIVAIQPTDTWNNSRRARTTVCRHGGLDNNSTYSLPLLSRVSAAMASVGTDYTTTCYSYNATAIAAGCLTYGIAPTVAAYIAGTFDEGTWATWIAANGAGTDPLLLDFEVHDPVTATAALIADMDTIMTMWKASSSRPLGIYNTAPYDNYWGPVLYSANADGTVLRDQGAGIMSRSMKAHDAIMAALGNRIDFISIRGYQAQSFAASGLARWKTSLIAMVLEAQRIADTRPIIPLLSYYIAGTTLFTEAQWIAYLQFASAIPGISGVAVWEGVPAPGDYNWIDAVTNLTQATGPFEPAP